MPFNGTGTYVAPSLPGSFNPAVTGQPGTAANWNTFLADLQTGLSTAICRDGQSTVTANIPFATYKITGLGSATTLTDAVAATQVTNNLLTGVASDTGAANAYAIAPAVAIAAYASMQMFEFIPANANTAGSTLAVSGLTAKTITRPNGDALIANDIIAGGLTQVIYDGAKFILLAGGNSAISYSLTTTRGDLIYRNATKPARLAIGAANRALLSDGTDPAWGQVSLTAGVTGTLPVANGGTGRTTSLTPITNSIAGDVALNNAAAYFTGPTVAQGVSGTWFAAGTVTVRDTVFGPATFYARLWDGTTVIDSAAITSNAGDTGPVTIALSGAITTPAGNIRIDVRDISATTGLILADITGFAKDSTLTVFPLF